MEVHLQVANHLAIVNQETVNQATVNQDSQEIVSLRKTMGNKDNLVIIINNKEIKMVKIIKIL